MPGHLIHIGSPKAGSTALGAWFAAHPQVDYRPDGIGGYHGAFELAARAAGPPTEQPLWQVTSSEALSVPRTGDVPSAHEDPVPRRAVSLAESRRRVCETLRRLSPGATILIVTRGFRGRAVSGYSQYVRMGGRLLPGEVLAGRYEPGEEWDANGLIELYRDAFGPDRVIVMPYELLRDEPERFVRLLEERLGLDGSPPLPALNVALAPEAIYWYRVLSIAVAAVSRVLGRRVGGWLYRRYVALIARDRLSVLAHAADRLLPGRHIPLDFPDEAFEPFRGSASSLAELPLYEPYARDYLNDSPSPRPTS
jgi:hypothetical protein